MGTCFKEKGRVQGGEGRRRGGKGAEEKGGNRRGSEWRGPPCASLNFP